MQKFTVTGMCVFLCPLIINLCIYTVSELEMEKYFNINWNNLPTYESIRHWKKVKESLFDILYPNIMLTYNINVYEI